MTEKATGQLTKWNDQRGFGFIRPDNGGPAAFVSGDALRASGYRLDDVFAGNRFSFDLAAGDGPRPHAINLTRLYAPASWRSSATPHQRPRREGKIPIPTWSREPLI